MKKILLASLFGSLLFANGLYYYDGDKKISLTQEKQTRNNLGIHYFKSAHGTRVGIKDTLIIKSKNINSVALKELEVIRSLGDDLYLIRANDAFDAISEANRLHQSSGVEFAVPEFYKRIELR